MKENTGAGSVALVTQPVGCDGLADGRRPAGRRGGKDRPRGRDRNLSNDNSERIGFGLVPECDSFQDLAGRAQPGAERAGVGRCLVVHVMGSVRDCLRKRQCGQKQEAGNEADCNALPHDSRHSGRILGRRSCVVKRAMNRAGSFLHLMNPVY